MPVRRQSLVTMPHVHPEASQDSFLAPFLGISRAKGVLPNLKLRLRETLTKVLAARALRTSSPQLQIRPVVRNMWVATPLEAEWPFHRSHVNRYSAD